MAVEKLLKLNKLQVLQYAYPSESTEGERVHALLLPSRLLVCLPTKRSGEVDAGQLTGE